MLRVVLCVWQKLIRFVIIRLKSGFQRVATFICDTKATAYDSKNSRIFYGLPILWLILCGFCWIPFFTTFSRRVFTIWQQNQKCVASLRCVLMDEEWMNITHKTITMKYHPSIKYHERLVWWWSKRCVCVALTSRMGT